MGDEQVVEGERHGKESVSSTKGNVNLGDGRQGGGAKGCAVHILLLAGP